MTVDDTLYETRQSVNRLISQIPKHNQAKHPAVKMLRIADHLADLVDVESNSSPQQRRFVAEQLETAMIRFGSTHLKTPERLTDDSAQALEDATRLMQVMFRRCERKEQHPRYNWFSDTRQRITSEMTVLHACKECIPDTGHSGSATRAAAAALLNRDQFPDLRDHDISSMDSETLRTEAAGLRSTARLAGSLGSATLSEQCQLFARKLKEASEQRKRFEDRPDSESQPRLDTYWLPTGSEWKPRDLTDYDTKQPLSKSAFDTRTRGNAFRDTKIIETHGSRVTRDERGKLANLLQDLAERYPSVAAKTGYIVLADSPPEDDPDLNGCTASGLPGSKEPLSAHLAPNPRSGITVYMDKVRAASRNPSSFRIGGDASDRMLLTMIHEFGHRIHDTAVMRSQTKHDSWAGVHVYDFNAAYDTWWNKTAEDGFPGAPAQFYAYAMNEQVWRNSSDYASHSDAEAVAEAFTDCWLHGDQAAYVNQHLTRTINTDIIPRDDPRLKRTEN